MSKASTQKKANVSVCQPPAPTKVKFLGPYSEAFCFLYRALGGGFFNFEFKPQSDVTDHEWNDPSITIYKIAALHHAVVRHQKLDNGKGSLEIFQAPYIAPEDERMAGPMARAIPERFCTGDCPEYTIDECELGELPYCDENGVLRCGAWFGPPGSKKGPTGKKAKSKKDRPAAK